MKVLRWLVSMSGGCLKALSFGMTVLSTGDFWKWAGIAFTFWLLHFISPYAAHWLSGFLGH